MRKGFFALLALAVLGLFHCSRAQPVREVSLFAAAATGNAFYVATNGSAGNPGTLVAPWSLAHALSDPAVVNPGDTIYLRGGTYSVSPYTSDLTGSATAQIMMQSYPGEWAKLDCVNRVGGGPAVLKVLGAYTTYRDFEIFCSVNSSPNGGQGMRPDGIQANGPNTKFVNLVIHDVGQGVSWSESATNSELSGSLIYYNGNSTLDHGVYCQNFTGQKWLKDNIFFNNYGFGIHAYASNARLDNFNIEGNVSFFNGKSNILIGGENFPAQNPKLIDNYTYHAPGMGAREMDVGYHAGSNNPTITGNYLMSGGSDDALWLALASGAITITGNSFYNRVNGFTAGAYPSNVYYTTRPTGTRVFVRPNAYELGRGNVAIYNWDGAASVAADLSPILTPGANFEVRHAANYFASPVLTGTYAGGSVSIPMNGLTMAPRVGWAAQTTTGPTFGAFVVRTVSGGAPLTPTLSPSSVPTQVATATPVPSTSTATPAVSPTLTVAPATATATVLPSPIFTPTPSLQPTLSPTPSPFIASLEAESGNVVAPMVMQTDALAQGGVLVTSATANQGTVSLDFTVVSAGTYKLMNRVQCISSGSDSSWVSVDGGVEVLNDFCDDPAPGGWIGGTWLWRDVTNRVLGLGERWTFSLSVGSHTVKMRLRDVNSAIDAVILTDTLGYVPAVETPTPVFATATVTATMVPPTATLTPTRTATRTVTNTRTPSFTRTPTWTYTPSRTPTKTRTLTPWVVCYTVTPIP